MSPQYEIQVHKGAMRELEGLDDPQKQALKDTIKSVASREEPATTAAVKSLSEYDGLFRIRKGRYRIICELAKPELRVLGIGKREYVYSNMDVVTTRQGEV